MTARKSGPFRGQASNSVSYTHLVARIPVDRFAAVAVRRGFLTRLQLETVLREIGLEAARNRQKLVSALVRRGDLTPGQVEKIFQILRGRDLWCAQCKQVLAIEHFDPQAEYTCPTCGMALRRVDGLDAQSNYRIEEIFDEMEQESGTVRLTRYKVIRRLGRGGMSKVYLAKHRKLQKLVAIKVLPPDLARDPTFVRRFAREGRTLAQLKHPNIVEVYDTDEERGVHFLVMEFVDGMSLRDLLDQSGLVSPSVAMRIMMDVCRALAHAHEHGFVHRDIKPGNILLGRTSEVKLTDFGLVREVSAESSIWTDAVLGTPYYMSPEQACGKSADTRSDVYSVGATLYAMLAGSPPLDGDDTMSILLKVAHDDPRPLQQVNTSVPRSLANLIERMMAKSPSDRPQTATEVLSELERCLSGNQRTTTRRNRA
ncbi:MAG: serine/threonine protein kinase [Planctomycetes bacterium]|nr:serine/threonine protein kinase [Planctomycetota bacterium]